MFFIRNVDREKKNNREMQLRNAVVNVNICQVQDTGLSLKHNTHVDSLFNSK